MKRSGNGKHDDFSYEMIGLQQHKCGPDVKLSYTRHVRDATSRKQDNSTKSTGRDKKEEEKREDKEIGREEKKRVEKRRDESRKKRGNMCVMEGKLSKYFRDREHPRCKGKE